MTSKVLCTLKYYYALKMEIEKYLIQIFDFGLEGDKFFFHLSICSCVGDNHKQDLKKNKNKKMGGKTKTERVSEKKNFELGKTRVGN